MRLNMQTRCNERGPVTITIALTSRPKHIPDGQPVESITHLAVLAIFASLFQPQRMWTVVAFFIAIAVLMLTFWLHATSKLPLNF